MSQKVDSQEKFNEFLKMAYRTILGSAIPSAVIPDESFNTSYKKWVALEVFGQQPPGEKYLISPEKLVFVNDPTTVTGIRVKGMTRQAWKEFENDVLDLYNDQDLKAQIKQSFSIPDGIQKIQNAVINILQHRMAMSRNLISQTIDQEQKDLSFALFDELFPKPTFVGVIKELFSKSLNTSKELKKNVSEAMDNLSKLDKSL